MPDNDASHQTSTTAIGGVSRLLVLVLLACGTLFAAFVLFHLAVVRVIRHAPDADILGVLAIFVLPAGLVLGGVATMLVARRWPSPHGDETVTPRPARRTAATVAKVVAVATLGLLPFHAFAYWWEYPDYSLMPPFGVWVVWLCWVIGGLLVSFMGRGQGPVEGDCDE